jgi:rRNA biogenesis protein RRP5
MAPIKRKGNAPEENNQKRAKVGAEEAKKDHKKSNDATPTAAKASELSVLRDDEPSFPRGGASVLTPLERKQIQIQANRDVLFEQKGTQKPSGKKPSNEFDDESDNDVEMEEEQAAAPAKKSRKKKTKGKKTTDKDSDDKSDVRIEGLSFKVCTPKPYSLYSI